jgi:hypothetical protein
METTNNNISSVVIRMYRAGTGDFFILTFKAGEQVSYKLMIDCGCIYGSKEIFTPYITDLKAHTGGVIDLLVVTHEHADHINGFALMADDFAQMEFKKVWFAWTEDRSDKTAGDYRAKNTKMKIALDKAAVELTGLKEEGYFERMYTSEYMGEDLLKAKSTFIGGIDHLNELNTIQVNAGTGQIATLEESLRQWKVIKENTVVEFLSPGELRQGLAGLEGIRIFVLGPPRNYSYLRLEEKAGETYQKRQTKSTMDFSFVDALTDPILGKTDRGPFDSKYESATIDELKENYTAAENEWRNIDHDWLFSAGALALRLQGCINNTSLALAFQFTGSEKVLLFPGDAEFGSWQSWQDNLSWVIPGSDGKDQTITMNYLLNHTVFYKVSHHLSQNGTASVKGIQQMTHQALQAVVTLDLGRIMDGWKKTMPNDIIGAELIDKTKGNIFFLGDRATILKNIKTDRVNVCTPHADQIELQNKVFDGKVYIELEIQA